MKIFFLMLLALLLNPIPVISAEWIFYGKTPNASYYYDKQGIVTDNRGIVRVWGKKVYTEEGKEDYLQTMKDKGLYNDTFEDISYGLDLYGINCKTREFDLIAYERRDEAGNIIDSIAPKHLSWNRIPQGSIVELLYEVVCKGNGNKIAL